MKVENESLMFTDPCYISNDEDWGDAFDYDSLQITGFSQYEWEDTGYGDGCPRVFKIPVGKNPSEFLENEFAESEDIEEIGGCGVDSGTFGVFLVREVEEYDPEFYDRIPPHCYTIIEKFSGSVYPERDENGNTHFCFKPNDPTKNPLLTD